MNMRRLRYFVIVAERLNFTEAAKVLGIAQPPLSIHIRNLEAEVGGELFHRERRKIRLTPLGLRLLDEARDLLQQADRVTERLRDAAEGRAGEIRITYTQSALSEKITRRIRKFLRKNRGVRLAAVRKFHGELPSPPADAVIAETLDAQPGAVILEKAHIQIAVPPKHRLADRTEVTLPDLVGESLILAPYPNRSPAEVWIATQIEIQGLKIAIAEGPIYFPDRLWLVSVGAGSSVCSSVDRNELDAVRLPLAGSQEIFTVCIPAATSRAVALPAFMEAIQE